MRVYDRRASPRHGLVGGQVLLAPLDFGVRQQYLHARGTLQRLLELGVVPVVNENDAIADDEIRFGDNDRLAALVAHLVGADLLVLLTDTPGLLTADPRLDAEASLIEEIVEFDHDARGEGRRRRARVRGSGGMASKVAAAKMAVVVGRADGDRRRRPPRRARSTRSPASPGVGTVVQPADQRLAARKLWIAFAVGSSGTVVVDDGARRALLERGVSLLPAGVVEAAGAFAADDAVEIAGPDGAVFAKGLVPHRRRPAARRWPGAAPPTCPTACRTGRHPPRRPRRRPLTPIWVIRGACAGRDPGRSGLGRAAARPLGGLAGAVVGRRLGGVGRRPSSPPASGADASGSAGAMPSWARISARRAWASMFAAACSISSMRRLDRCSR